LDLKEVRLYPYEFCGQHDDAWDKKGQAIGNIHALEKLYISTTCTNRTFGEHNEEVEYLAVSALPLLMTCWP
jgi:hypothetical protein